jgi:hypothetical protein
MTSDESALRLRIDGDLDEDRLLWSRIQTARTMRGMCVVQEGEKVNDKVRAPNL